MLCLRNSIQGRIPHPTRLPFTPSPAWSCGHFTGSCEQKPRSQPNSNLNSVLGGGCHLIKSPRTPRPSTSPPAATVLRHRDCSRPRFLGRRWGAGVSRLTPPLSSGTNCSEPACLPPTSAPGFGWLSSKNVFTQNRIPGLLPSLPVNPASTLLRTRNERVQLLAVRAVPLLNSAQQVNRVGRPY